MVASCYVAATFMGGVGWGMVASCYVAATFMGGVGWGMVASCYVAATFMGGVGWGMVASCSCYVAATLMRPLGYICKYILDIYIYIYYLLMFIDIVILTQICVFFSFIFGTAHHSEAAAGTHLKWIGILAADSVVRCVQKGLDTLGARHQIGLCHGRIPRFLQF